MGRYIADDGNEYEVNIDDEIIRAGGAPKPAKPKKPVSGAGLYDIAKEVGALKGAQSLLGGSYATNASEAATGLASLANSGAGMQAVGTALDGSTMMAPTSFVNNPLGNSTAVNAISKWAPGVAGAYGLYDLSQNRKRIGTGKGYLQGAASGAGIGFSLAGPVGAGVGAGLGLLGNALGIGHESRTKGEEKQRKALAEQGLMVPNSDIKEWENNEKFRQSRQESDLTGKDILHASDFYAKIPGYAELDAAKQEAITSKALELGLIREQLGKINLGDSAEFADFLKTQLAQPETGGEVRVDTSGIRAEEKKARKKQKVQALLSDLNPQLTQGPRYDINPGELINNPYL